jgi:hypothetical protein
MTDSSHQSKPVQPPAIVPTTFGESGVLEESTSFEITKKHPAEVASNIRIKEAQEIAQIARDNFTFRAAWIIVIIGAVAALLGLIFADASVKPTCINVLTLIMSGSVGYSLGAKGKKSD